MTKQEAISALRAGKKLTHRLFLPEEWICQNGYMIVTEDGYEIAEHLFWQDKALKGWNDGWSVVYEQEPEQMHIL